MTGSLSVRMLVVTAVAMSVAVCLTSTHAAAQVATGTIIGIVVDSSGQIVPGAQVTIRNVDSDYDKIVRTDGGSWGLLDVAGQPPDTRPTTNFSAGQSIVVNGTTYTVRAVTTTTPSTSGQARNAASVQAMSGRPTSSVNSLSTPPMRSLRPAATTMPYAGPSIAIAG